MTPAVRAVPVTARYIQPGDRLLYGPAATENGLYLTIGRDDATGICTVTDRSDPDEGGLIHLCVEAGNGHVPHPSVWETDVVWLEVQS